MEFATYVIVGGGIAGVTCVEHLSFLSPNEKVILVTATSLIKSITDIVPLSKTAYTYKVSESDVEFLKNKHLNLIVLYDKLVEIDSSKNIVITEKGKAIQYKYLCLCSGATPTMIPQAEHNPRILGIRDTDSVDKYKELIKESKTVVVVGNGGIASELVYATKDVHIVWVIKDKFISSTFIDPGAAEFFQTSSKFCKTDADVKDKSIVKRIKYTEESHPVHSGHKAAALGPDWLKGQNISGANEHSLRIIYEAQIKDIKNVEGVQPLEVEITTGEKIYCDLVISATGVTPLSQIKCDKEMNLGTDKGIAVDWRMETSIPNIFAAGDVATASWPPAPNWFQMRLWTQAYQMGAMAAKSMYSYFAEEEVLQDFCFELFSHTTNLFGYQVVLLGNYNGQKLDKKYEIIIRYTPNMEYIKFVLVDDKLQGAILIGETGLEETCENLILGQFDLSPYGDDILNPNIDIEDYFD